MKTQFLFYLFFSLALSVNGQHNDSLHNPKIGLVLSGGGAKGLAHIGVLKVLERNGIVPDYITGTSMGAIVGSLYASGYSAMQVDSIFHTLDFDKIMYDRYNRKYRQYYKKEYGDKYILRLPFSFRKMSLQLPRGLSNSQQMFNALVIPLLHVSNIDNFNALKISFACVSTDIGSGHQVLFNKGFLPETVTASALLPSVYEPMELNGLLLMDGGIVNNYPVKEVRDMGSDFVIGSDVQGRILDKNQINDITKIMDQIISFGMYEDMPLKRTMTDLYIRPDIKGIGLTDFDNMDSIIKRGERATESALEKIGDLSRLKNGKSINKLKVHQLDSLVFDRIIINGLKRYKREYILGKIDIRVDNKLSFKDFLDGINNLIGTENFEKVHYRFRSEGGENHLYLYLQERTTKASLNLGFHTNELDGINIFAGFENKRIFTNNDVLLLDIVGGNRIRYNFDYIIDNGFKLSWGLHSSLHQFVYQVSSDDLFKEEHYSVNKLDLNYLEFKNTLYFQGNLNHFMYLRVGISHQYKQLSTSVFSGDEDEAYFFGRNHYYGPFASLRFDNRDDYDFPTKGVLLKLKWDNKALSSDYYGDFKVFSLYNFHLNYTQSLFKYFIVQPDFKAGLYYGKRHTYDNLFYIGGMSLFDNYENLIGFEPTGSLSFQATKFLETSLKTSAKLFDNHYLSFTGSVLYYDQTNFIVPPAYKKVYGYNVSYGIKSFLGPVRVSFGRVPAMQRNHFSFSMGYRF